MKLARGLIQYTRRRHAEMYALALENLNMNVICSTIDSAFLTPIPLTFCRPCFTSPMANAISILSPISNASLSVTLGCWEQYPPDEPQLTPLTYIECKQAIQDIPMGEKALAPLSFGRDPGAGFTVPYTWDYGTCAIEIDVLREGDSERSTFAAIFKRAFDIAVECVIKSPHLGGKGLVGDNGHLKVWIYGVDPKVSSPSLVESNLSLSADTS